MKWKRGKRRAALKHKRPEQLVESLIREFGVVRGTRARGQVWIGATRRLGYLLEQTCLGRRARAGTEIGVPLTPNGAGNELVIRVCCEDAYYMCAFLRCLVVSEDGDEDAAREIRLGLGTREMDCETLWRVFRRDCGHAFALKCAATVHFRLTGWLPRSGLQYGADFVLYQRHPSLVHSDSTVVLVPDAAARRSFQIDDDDAHPPGVALDNRWPDSPHLPAPSRMAFPPSNTITQAHTPARTHPTWT